MGDKKHHVFSARTTEDGLRILNGIRAEKGIGWDGLIIDAVNAHYGVEVPTPMLTGPTPEERARAKAEREAEKAKKAREREEAKAKRLEELETPSKKPKKKATKKSEKAASQGKVKVYNSERQLVRTEDAEGGTVSINSGQD